MIANEDIYFKQILEKVKEVRNLDFSGYRENLLKRRVMVRARLVKRNNFEEYLAYLKFHTEEMDNLMDSLTINVTEFFRDSHIFDIIEKKVMPELFNKERMSHDAQHMSFRIWSCACSSGEEPYSVLMMVAEYLKSKLADHKVSIFATDIDAGSLSKAKEGVYEAAQFKNLSPARRELISKYFYDMGNKRYWIREEWSPYVDFMYHDFICDMPLENMDMILCRNVLIYFDRPLQDQVFERFHASLKVDGFLVLGNVESLGPKFRDRFEEFDRAGRIYRKRRA